MLPAEHPHNSQSALTVRATGKTTTMFYGKNADLRADQAGYNTPFAGVLQLLAVPSWHCHHQCPAAFSLDTCTSLIQQKLIPHGEQSQRWFIHLRIYLSGAGLVLSQVGKLKSGCAYQDGVRVFACQHTPMQEDGCTQQRVVHLFICSKQLQAGATGISTVLLHCVQVT